ncbi:hypothetical protein BGX34_005833, partial [Mortierella sp. NVP85]
MFKTYRCDNRHYRPRPTPPSTARAPLAFTQADNGACCTMALMNFLVNQTEKGPISKNLFESAQARVNENGHSYLVQEDDYLCSLHHFVLADMAHQNAELDTAMDLDPANIDQNQGNHLVVIFPYKGHVWELDSLDN